MMYRWFIGIGGFGALVAALCCFTPLLVIALGTLGLSALVGWWLDLILFPALVFFLILFGYGLVLRRQTGRRPDAPPPSGDRP